METDVLVVGAGPTGLMMANQLARFGVRVTIVDRHSGPAQQSRAMAVQARTLEIYRKLGIADQALALGRRGTGANLWARGKWTARVPLGDIGQDISAFPFVLMLGQDENERILGGHLRQGGVEIHWNTELTALEHAADHELATLRTMDGSTSTVRAAYVCGCDGAHSAVRRLNGIGFPGAPYEQTFFVADTIAQGPMRPGELNIYLWPDGFHLFFPMRGENAWRVIGILPKALRNRDDVTFEDVVPSILGEAGAAIRFAQCHWFSVYRIHHRSAERFRAGRCFLLGDAAHIHSPAGGQGMNTGLQDAYNLAWKLAWVLKGQAGESLLDTYEQERMPVAQRLLRTTDRLFQLVVSEGPIASFIRTRVAARLMALAMRSGRLRRLAFRTISQVGIRYRRSALSQNLGEHPGGAPRAGDRFPWMRLRLEAGGRTEDLFGRLDDSRFSVLAVGQPVPAGAKDAASGIDWIEVDAKEDNREKLAAAGIPVPSFYLLRPDGHVALAGRALTVEAVANWFREHGITLDEHGKARNLRAAETLSAQRLSAFGGRRAWRASTG